MCIARILPIRTLTSFIHEMSCIGLSGIENFVTYVSFIFASMILPQTLNMQVNLIFL